jgi:hypothetical protein
MELYTLAQAVLKRGISYSISGSVAIAELCALVCDRCRLRIDPRFIIIFSWCVAATDESKDKG